MVTQKSKWYLNKVFLVVLIDLLLVTGIITYFVKFRPTNSVRIHGTYINTPQEISEFHLIDRFGNTLTKEQFKGHWTLIFFGFTHCVMICPTTLAKLNTMYKRLERDLPENLLPQIVFISVDPDRDTLERLNQFIPLFNPHFIGARAETERVLALEKELHLAISDKNPMNHSMEIVLLNPEVKPQAYFAYPHDARQLVIDYKLILGSVDTWRL